MPVLAAPQPIVLFVQMKPVEKEDGTLVIVANFRNAGDAPSEPMTITLPCSKPDAEKDLWSGTRNIPALAPGAFYSFSEPVTHKLPKGLYSCAMQTEGKFSEMVSGLFTVDDEGKITNHQKMVVEGLTPKVTVSGQSDPGSKTGTITVKFEGEKVGTLPNRISLKIDGNSLGPPIVVKRPEDTIFKVPIAAMGLSEGLHYITGGVESIDGETVAVSGQFNVKAVVGKITMMEPPYERFKTAYIVKVDKPVFQYRLTDGTLNGLAGKSVTCTMNGYDFKSTTNVAGIFDCALAVPNFQKSNEIYAGADPHLRSANIGAWYQRPEGYSISQSGYTVIHACEAGYDIVPNVDRLTCVASTRFRPLPPPAPQTVNPGAFRPSKPPSAILPPKNPQ